MNPLVIQHASTILQHLQGDPVLSTLPPSARGVWLSLVLAMLERSHTDHTLPYDFDRLAEIAVAPVAECERAVGVLIAERALVRDRSLPLLRSALLWRLLKPAPAR